MFNLIIIAAILLLGLIGYNVKIEEIHIAGIVLMSGSLLYLVIHVIHDLSYYSSQLQRFEEIRSTLKSISIFKEKQNELLVDFKKYLSKDYPELEKHIIEKITDTKSDVHVVLKYPELKSSKMLIKLVDKINELANEIYSLKTDIEYTCSKIRYYKNGKWEIIKPNIPEDIYNVVYSKLKS